MHTLLFLHGWGSDGSVWREQGEYFGKRYKILTPDIIWPSLEKISAGIKNLVRGEEPLVIIGWSMGWLIALKLLEYPDLNIKGLVSIAGTPKFISDDYLIDGNTPLVLRAVMIKLKKDFAGAMEELRKNNIGLRYDKNRPEDKKGLFIEHLEMLKKEDLRANLKLIKSPTLFISGENDRVVQASTGRYMHDSVPGSRLRIIPDACHAVFLEKPGEVNKALDDFLSCRPGYLS